MLNSRATLTKYSDISYSFVLEYDLYNTIKKKRWNKNKLKKKKGKINIFVTIMKKLFLQI